MVSRLLLLLLFSAVCGLSQTVRIGLFTDVHYADKPTTTKRAYRDSLQKLERAVAAFNDARADFVVGLGDFIDSAPTLEAEMGYARAFVAALAKFRGPRHYVLGNHDVEAMTKRQFLQICGARAAHYSFEHGGLRFVVLDACYRADGIAYGAKNFQWTDSDIPATERDWLAANLKSARKPSVCFVHQRLDISGKHAVKSAATVRKIFEEAGNLLAVFQGHAHTNDLRQINGIRYWTLAAMVDTPGGYSILEIRPDLSLRLSGCHGHKNYDCPASSRPGPTRNAN